MSDKLLIFAVLPIVGAALLWTLRLMHDPRSSAPLDPLRQILTTTAWLLIFAGLILPMIGAAGLIGFALALATLVIAAMVVTRYRDTERRALLWALSLAADKNMPLAPAARALAQEGGGEMGFRALRLAQMLEAGVPLPEALRRSGNRLPLDAELATQLGHETGALGPLLKLAVRDRAEMASVVQSFVGKLVYQCCVLLLLFSVAVVVMLKIVPSLQKIFSDFDTELPAVTQLVIAASEWIIPWQPVWLVLWAVMIVAVLSYMGWMRWEPPIVRRLWRRVDGALILRTLAETVEWGRPLTATIKLLAHRYPKAHIRRRLHRAAEKIDQGADWCDSLRETGLIVATDAAVLKAAQRVGNLPWALREMADSGERRLVYRLNAALTIAFPVIAILVAIPIVLFELAIFVPVVELLTGLSS